MEENSNINPEILEECRRLAQEKGFGDAMATVLMEKYQMSYIDFAPYFRIIDKEISEAEKSEKQIKDYIKQLIEEHGINQKLLITKLTQGKFDIPLIDAKNLVDELCEIVRINEESKSIVLTPEMENDIRDLIEKEGIDNKLLIANTIKDKYCPKHLIKVLSFINEVYSQMQKNQETANDFLQDLEDKDLKKKDAEKNADISVKLSLAIMAIAVILILAPLGIENFPKVFFYVGIVFFIVAMVFIIEKGDNKKR